MAPTRCLAFLFALALAPSALGAQDAARTLDVFAGSASRPALEELVFLFERKTGTRVHVHFGGSGAVLSQMELARRGDVYLPGSSDFMERAKRHGLVDSSTETRLFFLLPAINVVRGNPRGIYGLEDLARPGLRVGIARPDTVCVGLYGVEALERSGLSERVRPNIVNWAESCEKTAQMLSLGLVDAVLGWDVFDDWDPGRIETVLYAPDAVPRIGYAPGAVSTFARDPDLAQRFLAFLSGAEGKNVFRRHGYLPSLEEARARARPDTPVGGEFPLPPWWR